MIGDDPAGHATRAKIAAQRRIKAAADLMATLDVFLLQKAAYTATDDECHAQTVACLLPLIGSAVFEGHGHLLSRLPNRLFEGIESLIGSAHLECSPLEEARAAADSLAATLDHHLTKDHSHA